MTFHPKESMLMMTDEDLLHDLDEYDPEGGPGADEEFAPVTDEETARKYLRWLRGVRRDVRRIKATAKRETERIKAWADDRTAGLERRQASLERSLEGWTRAHLSGSKRRSVVTPFGTVKLIKPKASIEFSDEEAFVAWCEANGRLDLLKLAPSRSAINDALTAGTLAAGTGVPDWPHSESTATQLVADAGEVVPGAAVVTPKLDNFSAKTDDTSE